MKNKLKLNIQEIFMKVVSIAQIPFATPFKTCNFAAKF